MNRIPLILIKPFPTPNGMCIDKIHNELENFPKDARGQVVLSNVMSGVTPIEIKIIQKS